MHVVLLVAATLVIAGAATAASGPVKVLLREEAVVNGMPLSFAVLHSPLPPSAFLGTGAGPASVARSRGPVREILEVRADPQGGSRLLWSRLDLRRSIRSPAELPITLPSGSRVLRTITLQDRTQVASQFAVALRVAPESAAALLCDAAQRKGWRRPDGPGCDSRPGHDAQWLLRGAETLGVTIMRAGRGSRAVIGHVAPARGER